MKLPFMKFFVRDWMGDAQLRMCSIGARGLWFEMLCLMQCAKRYGYLETQSGKPLTDDETSRLIGTNKDDLYTLKQELLDHDVPSVEEDTGIWYCRRMVREEQKRNKCSNAGKSGGGNPALRSSSSLKDTDTIFQNPDTRSHISINATYKGDLYREQNTEVKKKRGKKPKADVFEPDDFKAFYEAYPKKVARIKALDAWNKAYSKPTVDVLITAINAQKQTAKWQENGGEFIPHPATWLNQGRWDDALTTEIDKPKYFED